MTISLLLAVATLNLLLQGDAFLVLDPRCDIASTSPEAAARITFSDEEVRNLTLPSTYHGVTYNIRAASGACKAPSQVEADMRRISGKFNTVRTYGVECPESIRAALRVSASTGLRLHLGVWMDENGRSNTLAERAELQRLMQDRAFAGARVEVVSAGNEVMLRTKQQVETGISNGIYTTPQAERILSSTAQDLVEQIRAVRSIVRASPYHANASVSYVEEWVSYCMYSPQLLPEVDRVDVNLWVLFAVPYGGRTLDATAAAVGRDTLNFANWIEETWANGKDVAVSECGWPSAGATGPQNQNQGSQELASAAYLSVLRVANAEMRELFIHEDHDSLDKVNDPLYERNLGLSSVSTTAPCRTPKYPQVWNFTLEDSCGVTVTVPSAAHLSATAEVTFWASSVIGLLALLFLLL